MFVAFCIQWRPPAFQWRPPAFSAGRGCILTTVTPSSPAARCGSMQGFCGGVGPPLRQIAHPPMLMHGPVAAVADAQLGMQSRAEGALLQGACTVRRGGAGPLAAWEAAQRTGRSRGRSRHGSQQGHGSQQEHGSQQGPSAGGGVARGTLGGRHGGP
jgi:hypothetical protein